MRRRIVCVLILIFGIAVAAAMGGAGKRPGKPVYTEDDIAYICDINTAPFEKNTDERLVRYEFADEGPVRSVVFHARGTAQEQILQKITLCSGEVRRSAYVYFPEGEEYAFLPAEETPDAIEMHESMQTLADAIEFHTGELTMQAQPQRFRIGVFLCILALTVLTAAAAWITDRRYGWCESLFGAGASQRGSVGQLKGNDPGSNGFGELQKAWRGSGYAGQQDENGQAAEGQQREATEPSKMPSAKRVKKDIAEIVLILIVSVAAAKLIPGIAFGRRALAVYLAGMGLTGYSLWSLRKELVAHTERIFLRTALFMGAVLLLVAPVGHGGWDTDMHYAYALQASGAGSATRSLSELLLTENMPDAAVDEMPAVNRLHEGLLEACDGRDAGEQSGPVYLTHLPSGIGLALGRLMGLGFSARFRLGEAMNLIVYVLLTYFAIRRLHSGKVLLALIALIPTNLFLASTYGYDYWVIGFLHLGAAYFIGMLQEGEKEVRTTEVCVMAVSLSLGCLLKQNYLPVVLLVFFMPRKKLKKPLRYYLLCILPVLLLGLSLFLRGKDVAQTGGDLRGGSVDAAAQLSGILRQPLSYLKVLLPELLQKLSPVYYCKAVTNYGEFGYSDVTALALLYILLIVIAAFADRDACDEGVRGLWLKIFAVLNYLGGVVLILTAFYLVYTPVGAPEIRGVQARYFTPLIYPLLAVIGTEGRRIFRDRAVWKERYLTGVYLAGVLLFFGTALRILIRA